MVYFGIFLDFLIFYIIEMGEVKIGRYEHYNGKFYEVVGVARHSETLEELVVYRALYESEEFGSDVLWVRPKSMFVENVYVDGVEVPRFRFVG